MLPAGQPLAATLQLSPKQFAVPASYSLTSGFPLTTTTREPSSPRSLWQRSPKWGCIARSPASRRVHRGPLDVLPPKSCKNTLVPLEIPPRVQRCHPRSSTAFLSRVIHKRLLRRAGPDGNSAYERRTGTGLVPLDAESSQMWG